LPATSKEPPGVVEAGAKVGDGGAGIEVHGLKKVSDIRCQVSDSGCQMPEARFQKPESSLPLAEI
jgi:hypothetical protein